MSLIDLDALERTALSSRPYDHLITPAFVPEGALAEVVRDFPRVAAAGSYPPSELEVKGAFARLLEEMDGPGFRAVIEEKFGLDLSGRPTMFTVRGRCRKGNGSVHTDTESKIISVLLYLNESWEAGGGRLRVLNSPDLNDVAVEVPPWGGALLAFRRSERSWHGHETFEGVRRVVQMNWVTDEAVVRREQGRHRLTALIKRLPFASRAGGGY